MVYNVTEKETQPKLWNNINGTPEEILDRHCVAELAKGWPVYRDSSEWKHYRDCFAEEGGYIFTSKHTDTTYPLLPQNCHCVGFIISEVTR